MDAFLQNHSNLSFNALVDQEEDNGQLGQVEAPGFLDEPERPAKTKKSKKDKKAKKGLAEDSARRTTTESKDDSVDDNWQAQDDPYMTVDEQDLAQGAVCDDDEDDLPVVSKRAMQRAVKGFTRRSGGWKHRKKPAAAGKGSAKGRGKNCFGASW